MSFCSVGMLPENFGNRYTFSMLLLYAARRKKRNVSKRRYIFSARQGKFKSNCMHFCFIKKHIVVEGCLYHTIFQFFISYEEMFLCFRHMNGVAHGQVSWIQNIYVYYFLEFVSLSHLNFFKVFRNHNKWYDFGNHISNSYLWFPEPYPYYKVTRNKFGG